MARSSSRSKRLWAKQLLHQFKESGQSLYKFCKTNGYSYSVLSYWRRKLFPATSSLPQENGPQAKFVELVEPASSTRIYLIILGNDFSSQALAELIKALEVKPC